ncbi:MAG: tetraacyldisaccharide 4'-kinase [Bdellovibrionaceae bacterium]|nr:tetraacyldisaccharide 4'-kinase [Pseudobdellovibrionaceae bacterium]
MRNWLLPLSGIYFLIVQLRNLFFDWGWFKATKTKTLVVSVGNISAGGTGKTPLTAFFCRELENKGYRMAIVSRGYGAQYSEAAVRVDLQQKNAASYFGDEPVMLASQLNIPVYVGRSRVLATELAIQDFSADCVVADDAFQHRWLHRDLNILVFDATESRLQLLPAGQLREPLKNIKRSHVVFVTRASQVSLRDRQAKLELLQSYGFSPAHKNLFFVEFRISNIIHVHTFARMMGSECFLLSAIGKPHNFEAAMKEKFTVHKHFVFPDHHQWSQSEWSAVIDVCKKSGGYPLVITEKDSVKIKNLNSNDYPVYFAQVDVAMDKDFKIDNVLSLAGVVR